MFLAIRRFWALLFLSFLPLLAYSATCVQYSSASYPQVGWHSTFQGACSATLGVVNGFWASSGVTGFQVSCDSGQIVVNRGGSIYNFPLTSRQTSDCADQCKAKASTSEIVNITAGWARSGAETTPSQEWVHTYRLPASGTASFCSADGCEQSIDANEPCSDCAAYTSQVPGSNGLYRKSIDFRGHYSGAACDPSKSEVPRDRLNPNDAIDPPCPGYVGEVNGVKGCYGNASNPINTVPGEMPKAPQDNGNPAAGPKPGSGEGSGAGGAGRTPSAGTGGSAGGPAGAAAGGTGSGTKPNGTTDKPGEGKEQAACGAPGQPKCRIDETGTPDGKSAYDDAKKQLDDADKSRKEALDKISDTSDKNTSWGQSFGWVQHGGCQPWNLGTIPLGAGIPLTVDICPILPYIEWVTSFLWALVTFALTIGMVFRVTTASSS